MCMHFRKVFTVHSFPWTSTVNSLAWTTSMSSFAVAIREHSSAPTYSVLYFFGIGFFCVLVQSDSLLALFRMNNFNAPSCGRYIGVLFSWVFSVRSLIAPFPVPSLAVVSSVPSYAEVCRVLSCSKFSSALFVRAFFVLYFTGAFSVVFFAGGGEEGGCSVRYFAWTSCIRLCKKFFWAPYHKSFFH